MANGIPSVFWRFPSILDWEEEPIAITGATDGLTVSEDNKNVYVEAALPGIDPKDIEITFDKWILWVKGEKKEEEKNKKYHRKATSSFSYRLTVPGEVSAKTEPKAESKNGVIMITFGKTAKLQPKKITVKAS